MKKSFVVEEIDPHLFNGCRVEILCTIFKSTKKFSAIFAELWRGRQDL